MADTGEIRNARAAIYLAEGDPNAALNAVEPVITADALVLHAATTVEAQLLSA